MKVRTMLIISMVVFSLLSMTVFTIVVSASLSSAAEGQYKQMINEMVKKQSFNLEVFFESYTQRLQRIAGNPAVVDFINSRENKNEELADSGEQGVKSIKGDEYERALYVLNTLTEEGSGITGITIFDSDNQAILTAGSNQQEFIDSARRERLAQNQFVAVLSSEERAGTQQKINTEGYGFELMQYKKVSDSHYIISTYSSYDIDTLFARSTLPTHGKLILVCPYDNLLDGNLMGNLHGQTSDSIPKTSGQEYAVMTPKIKEKDSEYRDGTFYTYEVGRTLWHATFEKVGETGWLLGMVARDTDMNIRSSSAIRALLNCTLIVGIAMVLFSVLFVFRFTKPLVIIKDVLMKVRRGNHEIRIDIQSQNDYGDIAHEFNSLLDNVVVGEGRYRTVMEMSDSIIFEWNFMADTVSFSHNFVDKFSYRAPSDSYEDSFLNKCKVHPEDTDNYKNILQKLAKGEPIHQDEFRWKNIFGDYVWFLLRANAIHGPNGEVVKVVGVIVDIDRAKKSEKILSAKASYDALTGLYNRETLESLINNEIDLISVRKNEFAILFIDVDDFKFFNDNYSHATGDQVLRFTALSINDIVSKYGMTGRFGGDEFVVCVRNSEINDPSKTAEEILARLKEGFVCDVGDRLSVNVSIGIAVLRDSTKRVDEIIGMADDAMYKIKKSGKSNYGYIT